VGIQCFFSESLPTKNTIIMALYDESFVLTISYLTVAQRCWISSSLQTQIPENGWRPFCSLSKLAPCFKVVSNQHELFTLFD
jgi:hypothetical protein